MRISTPSGHLPSIDLVRSLLRYEPETGKLFWLPRDVSLFKASRRGAEADAKHWNSRFAGKVAGSINGGGYRNVYIFGRRYGAHRIAWLLHYGSAPSGVIDHINGQPDDNRISNLRDVSHQVNAKNSRLMKNNTSGHNGVSRHKATGKWQAYVMEGGRQVHLGVFVEKEDAIAARDAASTRFGFHPDHGRRA